MNFGNCSQGPSSTKRLDRRSVVRYARANSSFAARAIQSDQRNDWGRFFSFGVILGWWMGVVYWSFWDMAGVASAAFFITLVVNATNLEELDRDYGLKADFLPHSPASSGTIAHSSAAVLPWSSPTSTAR